MHRLPPGAAFYIGLGVVHMGPDILTSQALSYPTVADSWSRTRGENGEVAPEGKPYMLEYAEWLVYRGMVRTYPRSPI